MTQDKRAAPAGKLPSSKRGPQWHPKKFQRISDAPHTPRSLFDAAILLAIGAGPIPPGALARDGREAAMLDLLGPRCTPAALNNYRLGRRKPPPWARAILRYQLEARAAELAHYAALLAAEPD